MERDLIDLQLKSGRGNDVCIEEDKDGDLWIELDSGLNTSSFWMDISTQKQFYEALKLKFEDSHGRIKTTYSTSNREL